MKRDLTSLDKRVLDRVRKVWALDGSACRVAYEPDGHEVYYDSIEDFFDACKEEEWILREDDLAEKVARKVVEMLKREETD